MSIQVKERKRKAKVKAKMGAPTKPDEEKIQTNHLREDQQEWLEREAAIRNVSMWAFARTCLDWAKTALDTKRGDVDASKLFDNIMADNEGDVT